MNARLYDPSLGRFITPDTLVPYPGNGQSYNRYSYANNNPLSHVDPTGRFHKKVMRGLRKAISKIMGNKPQGKSPLYLRVIFPSTAECRSLNN